ncbi:MAG TPA: CsgG/HfaB family protein, partial [Thermoanaerobaculia bacterium]
MKRFSTLALSGALLLAVLAAPGLTRAAGKGGGEKPRIAVLELKNKADNQWWYHGGATAAQDVFVTELVKSGKFTVVDRERLDAMMQEKGLQQSGDIDPKTAIKLGKILGLNYLLTGAVTEYGNTDVG